MFRVSSTGYQYNAPFPSSLQGCRSNGLLGLNLLLVMMMISASTTGCSPGAHVTMPSSSSTGAGGDDEGHPMPHLTLLESRVEGTTWVVVLESETDPHIVPITLNGRPVRGCGYYGPRIACRLLDLRPGDHLLQAGSGSSKIDVWERVGPFDWRQAVLYFVITDRFRDGDSSNNQDVDQAHKGAFHGGDFAGLHAKLDHLKSLGINGIWITPIVKQIDHPVTGAGFPDWGYHGYWADDFNALEPRLGTEDELVALVEDVQSAGIRMLLDVVLNHPGYGSSYLSRPGWTRSVDEGTCPGEDTVTERTRCLFGLPDFRTELPQVRQYLLEAHSRWMALSGADGVRIDTAKHVEMDFLAQFSQVVRAIRPDAFLLGEVWGSTPRPPDSRQLPVPDDPHSEEAYFVNGNLDGLFDFSFADNLHGFLSGRGRPQALAAYLTRRNAAILAPTATDSQEERPRVWAHFLNTHDTTGFLHRLGGDSDLFRLAAILQMTVAGLAVVYYGDEVGRQGGEWPHNRSFMPPRDQWDTETLALYRTLIRNRRLHPSLSMGTLSVLHAEGDVLVFQRALSSPERGVWDLAIVAVNRGEEPATVQFNLSPELTRCPPLQDALANYKYVNLDSPTVQLHVPARGARLLLTEE